MRLSDLVFQAHQASREKGFYEISDRGSALGSALRAQKLALIHAEVSEVLEAERKPEPESSEKIPGFMEAEEELADVIIRVCDYAGWCGYDLESAVKAKMAYNGARPHKHGKAF